MGCHRGSHPATRAYSRGRPHMARGPEPIELALQRCARLELDGMRLDEQLTRWMRDRREAQAALSELGIDPPLHRGYSRQLTVALQVDRGDAFWDREPADPAPIEIHAG